MGLYLMTQLSPCKQVQVTLIALFPGIINIFICVCLLDLNRLLVTWKSVAIKWQQQTHSLKIVQKYFKFIVLIKYFSYLLSTAVLQAGHNCNIAPPRPRICIMSVLATNRIPVQSTLIHCSASDSVVIWSEVRTQLTRYFCSSKAWFYNPLQKSLFRFLEVFCNCPHMPLNIVLSPTNVFAAKFSL